MKIYDTPEEKRKTFLALKLPVGGGKAQIIPIEVFAHNDHSTALDVSINHFPDFRPFWKLYDRDRMYQLLTMTNQEESKLNGQYTVYWNKNDELPENKWISNALGMLDVYFPRHFWYGDVFIFRLVDDIKQDLRDVPPRLADAHALKAYFSNNWKTKELEYFLEDGEHSARSSEENNAQKAIVYGRM